MLIGLRPYPHEIHRILIKMGYAVAQRFPTAADARNARCPTAKDGSVRTPVSAPSARSTAPAAACLVRRRRQSWAGMVAVSMTKR